MAVSIEAEVHRFGVKRKELEIDKLFRALVKLQGSDLHLKVDCPPYVRVDGTLRPLNRGPVDDEEMARFTGVRDSEIYTNIVDYAVDYPQGTGKIIAEVSYEELRSGTIRFDGKEIPTSPLSSYAMALEICGELKRRILEEGFTLGVPQHPLQGPKGS